MRECLPYFVIYVCIVILVGIFSVVFPNLPQYPSVVTRARGCYSVGRVSGSAGPQFYNCARGPFCGPRDPEGSDFLDFSGLQGWKVVSQTHRPPLPQEKSLVLTFRG